MKAPTLRCISRLNSAASVLAVYASSNALLHSHARLASGWWLAFTGRDSNPLDSTKGFSSLFHTSSFSRFILALPFPHPAHRTGHADLPHPALGQDFTPSPTPRCVRAHSVESNHSDRRGA